MDSLEGEEDPNVVRVLLWVLETRDPGLYERIQSQRPRLLKNSVLAQAETLAYEYRAELEDSDIDGDCLYKTFDR
ncbi:hypothetical protein [Furfurilactobacillus entadae]|uniref:hypothetical protein n=1 Tax=Furfurilactobacillus entadae TaxID=2922307 RepID=UPI0035ED8DE6